MKTRLIAMIAATATLAEHHPGARVIGAVSDAAGTVTLPGLGFVL